MSRARFRTGWVADESGAIAVFVAAGIAVFISMAALAVDLGMLMTARSEAQRTADGAALAGAASLIYRPNNAEGARQWAREYASQNDVRGQQVVLRDEDIDVIADLIVNHVSVESPQFRDYLAQGNALKDQGKLAEALDKEA